MVCDDSPGDAKELQVPGLPRRGGTSRPSSASESPGAAAVFKGRGGSFRLPPFPIKVFSRNNSLLPTLLNKSECEQRLNSKKRCCFFINDGQFCTILIRERIILFLLGKFKNLEISRMSKIKEINHIEWFLFPERVATHNVKSLTLYIFPPS